jgi:hypothetical protein
MNSHIVLQSTLVAAEEQVSADLSGEVVILNMRSGEYFGLNAVGARIWELIQKPRTVLDVRDRLMEEFPEVDEAQCTRDLLDLVAELVDAQLVEVVATAEASTEAGA